MARDHKTRSVAVEPMKVTVIQGTGDGSGSMSSGTTAVTPAHQPDLLIQVVSPLAAILIRFVNAYLTAFVGLLMAGMTTDVIPAADFLALAVACSKLSVAGPAVSAIKDVITIFGQLEGKFPLLTGSV